MILELHAIQSFAPANLNRDDTGAPKSATFGGVRRARVSSQSWKRAIREEFRRAGSGIELGVRTKRAHAAIVDRLLEADPTLEPAVARHRAAVVLEAEPLGLSLKHHDGEDAEVKTGQLIFFRPQDLDALAQVATAFAEEIDGLPSSVRAAAESTDGKKAAKVAKSKLTKDPAKAVKTAMTSPSEAIDVALFGRMVAELPEANVDASCQVAHALGTHRLTDDSDFYTAVDDERPEDTEGADMIGNIQFNASCLYRYAVLDEGQLARNLGVDEDDPAVAAAARAFVEAFVTAIPTGKQNSFAARNPPSAVVGVRRSHSAWNLANAFATPVDARNEEGGLVVASTRRMLEQFSELSTVYGRPGDDVSGVFLTVSSTNEATPAGLTRVTSLSELSDHVVGA